MSEIGHVFTATVEQIIEDGRGLVRHSNGRVFFVPGVVLGERVRCRVDKITARSGSAVLEKLIEPSSKRSNPVCVHHGFNSPKCGGCAWMHIDYDTQLQYKQSFIRTSVDKLHTANLNTLQQIIPSPKILAYRNRAQLKTNGEKIGFTVYQSNKFAPIESCSILSEKNKNILAGLKKRLPIQRWKPNKRSPLNIVHINESVDADCIDVNQEQPFAQANTSQNRCMKTWLAEKLKRCEKTSPVIELFCGSGNFTHLIAEIGFSKVFAFEGDERAVSKLSQQAASNSWPIEVSRYDLFNSDAVSQAKFRHKQLVEAKTLVLDPPRSGFTLLSSWVEALPALEKIIYVSCKPATFFRDAAVLTEHSFELTELQPIDQFPHTPHVELLAFFSRANDQESAAKDNKKIKNVSSTSKKVKRRGLRKF